MTKKTKILYVDDEESNLRIFKDTFRRDFEIYLAISGRKALEILEQNQIDLIITDQRMPEMTGVELLEEINKRFPSIPPHRLILSGYAEDNDIKEAFEKYKLLKFVSKPWNYNEFKENIINAIKY